MFEYNDGDMKMKTDLDMNNKKIKNLTDPEFPGDVVNKRTLDTIDTKIIDLSRYTKDFVYRSIFPKHYHDLQETSLFNLVKGINGVVIAGAQPNFVLGADRFINDYSLKYGLKLSRYSHILTDETFNQNTSYTFFMSFLHDTTKIISLNWANTSNNSKYFPVYEVTNNKIIIRVPSKSYKKNIHE